MKYLRDDFLEEIDFSLDSQKKELWLEGFIKYRRYFISLKNHFPEDFYKLYLSTEMHDFVLEGFQFFRNKEFSVVMNFKRDDQRYILTFCGVRDFVTDLKIQTNYPLEHVLGEFTKISPNLLKYEFVLNNMGNNHRIIVVFQKLRYSTEDGSGDKGTQGDG